ncbi:hypothetical protein NDU88_010395 [Pleurodeles waltl]|uniref:Uncharacterized protein n=1 Tax=Pleurodeles waltl TaxID=8319 RepID=A0AAV7R035_PLEWA|nr:hypothetical protein NDU88_010395 [Pleurodeles waltl]
MGDKRLPGSKHPQKFAGDRAAGEKTTTYWTSQRGTPFWDQQPGARPRFKQPGERHHRRKKDDRVPSVQHLTLTS